MTDVNSIDDILEVVDVVPLNIGIAGHVRAKFTSDARYFYVLNPDAFSGGVANIVRIDRKTYSTDTLRLLLPGDVQLHPRGTALDIAVSERYVCVLYWRMLYIFRVDSHGAVVAQPRVVPHDITFHSCSLDSEAVYLYTSDINGAETAKTQVMKVDPQTGEVRWQRQFPDPNGIEFTFFKPRQAIQLASDGVIVSDIDRYAVHVYGFDGIEKQVLTRSQVAWPELDTSYRRFSPMRDSLLARYPKLAMDSLRRYVQERPMVRMALLANDSTLLVAIQQPKKYLSGWLENWSVVTFDVWRRDGGQWKLAYADLADFNPSLASRFSEHRMLPLSFEFGTARPGLLWKKQAYVPGDLLHMTYNEIRSAAESYAVEQSERYEIVLFALQMD